MTEVESTQALEAISSHPSKVSLDDFRMNLNNIIYQVSIAKDGDAWCALIGNDLQNGISGFGKTVQQALYNLADKITK